MLKDKVRILNSLIIGAGLGAALPAALILTDMQQLNLPATIETTMWLIKGQNAILFSVIVCPILFSLLSLQTHIIFKRSKRLALEKSANKAKTDFLANISHEIRTPLNAILGITEILRMHTDKEGREILDIQHQSGNVLLNLINDILDISKIEAEQLELEYLPFHLDSV